ncbi:hypothetical protein Tco_0375211 [Tanacetum coccineum]
MQTKEGKVDTSKELDASLVDTKRSGTDFEKALQRTFAKPSILGKPVLQPHRNQSVVRQPNAFKSERLRISKPWFPSQVDVNNDLSKPVTTHYLPKGKESACAKPHHMIAPGSSSFHYLEEAKKKTQERDRNSRPSVMPSARSQSTSNDCKPKPRSNTQTSRNWPASKRKIFESSTTKVDSEPTNGSNKDITNQYECEKTLDVSAGTLNLSAGTSFNPKKEGLRVCLELGIHDHSNEPSSSKLVLKVVPRADKTATSQQELELLFSPMYEEYFNAGNPSVSKYSAPSDNLQQHDTQPIANIHPTLEPIIPPSNNNVEDNK